MISNKKALRKQGETARVQLLCLRWRLPNEKFSKLPLSCPLIKMKKPLKLETSTVTMAERGGFEPPRRYYRPTGIRSQTLQPLGYLSTAMVIITYSPAHFQENKSFACTSVCANLFQFFREFFRGLCHNCLVNLQRGKQRRNAGPVV